MGNKFYRRGFEMKFDRSLFVSKFKEEAKEHLQDLNAFLLVLEKEPRNATTLSEIIRVCHTLKGSARMVGFLDIDKIAHGMEDIFQEVKEGRLELNGQLFDLLFESFDTINALLEGRLAKADFICHCFDKVKRGEGIEVKPRKKEEKVRDVRIIEETVRVKLEHLDRLVNLIGEVVINQNRFKQMIGNLSDPKNPLSKLKEDILRMDLIIDDLQQVALQMRMMPVSIIFDLFPRAVRDLAKEYDKEVELEIRGGETNLDKKILEYINDPLIHLVRNAISHGIESKDERLKLRKPEKGRIILSAYEEGDHIIISIEDDGRGIDIDSVKEVAIKKGLINKEDLEKMSRKDLLYLICEPEFSTSKTVNDLAGRGVGMDVVKRNIEDLKGTISIDSEPGIYTRITLSLPLTLAITRVLLISLNGQVFGIPTSLVVEILKIQKEEIKTIETYQAIQVRGETLPLVRLKDILGLEDVFESEERDDKLNVVIITFQEQKIGFLVDEVISEQEVVIKSLDKILRKQEFVTSSTILGGGEVVIILHIPDLVKSARLLKSRVRFGVKEGSKKVGTRRILVVEDSLTTRELEKGILEGAGYEVEVASDGEEAMNKVKERSFDLIVTDIKMPRMDGFELTRRLKSDDRYKDIPVVIVTAREKEEDREKGAEVGAQTYVVKSRFSQEDLLDTIERLI
ncbi:MAG: hybrid sensor histidine kinase/response regulator [bacterium]|nr:hybrid sensor histidine kinase/response regulator [bacterium]